MNIVYSAAAALGLLFAYQVAMAPVALLLKTLGAVLQ